MWGRPIKRLYSAGNRFPGNLYQSDGNLGECLIVVRIVGLNAAAESPVTVGTGLALLDKSAKLAIITSRIWRL
jgi:hypothetical protein